MIVDQAGSRSSTGSGIRTERWWLGSYSQRECVSLGIEVIDSFSGHKCRVRFEDAWCRIDTFQSSVITVLVAGVQLPMRDKLYIIIESAGHEESFQSSVSGCVKAKVELLLQIDTF